MTDNERLLDQLKKEFGDTKVFRASETPPVKVTSTGIAALDFATGIGGIPEGTVVEVFGRESAGKTALAYYMIAEQQKKGGLCAFINLEGSFDAQWAAKIAGVRLEDLVVLAPDPGTEAVKALTQLVNTVDGDRGVFDLIVFDSIGAMLTDKEQKVGSNKQAGGQSGLVTHMVNQVLVPVARNKTTVVFLNQVRDVFDSMYKIEDSPGGHFVKHAAVMRIHLKPGPPKEGKEEIMDGEKTMVMFRVKAKIKKNKVGAPNRSAGWNFWNYENDEGVIGVDIQQDLIDTALQQGVFERKGAWYQHPLFPGEKKQLQGAVAVTEFLKKRPDVFSSVKQELADVAYNQERQQERETLG